MKINNIITTDLKWKIKGFDNYGFGSNKKLYNLKTKREIKQTVVCSSIGYWMDKKFITLNKLKPLIYAYNGYLDKFSLSVIFVSKKIG